MDLGERAFMRLILFSSGPCLFRSRRSSMKEPLSMSLTVALGSRCSEHTSCRPPPLLLLAIP